MLGHRVWGLLGTSSYLCAQAGKGEVWILPVQREDPKRAEQEWAMSQSWASWARLRLSP